MGTWPATQACALTRNWTSNLLVCRPALNLLSHTNQGSNDFFSGVLHSWKEKSNSFSCISMVSLRSVGPWERESEHTGISASCQFKILSNFRLFKVLCVCTGNISDERGEKVKISFRKSKLRERHVTNRFTPGVRFYFFPPQPFFPEAWCIETERKRGRRRKRTQK